MTTTVAQHTPAPNTTPDSATAQQAAPARQNLLGLSREQMEAFFLSIGEKKFRATQVMKWIHQEGIDDFTAMTNLSKPLRDKLSQVAEIRGPGVVYEGTSSDGTRKWVLEVEDGSYVEEVEWVLGQMEQRPHFHTHATGRWHHHGAHGSQGVRPNLL